MNRYPILAKALFGTLFILPVMFLAPLAHAATLSFGGANSVKVGDTFNVRVLVSTANGESANAVSGTVDYPTGLLSLQSMSKGGSIITLWPTDPTMGNGTAEFGGIILNPGWSGTQGTVVLLTFKALAQGTAKLAFEGDATVLANDGNATPILSGTSPHAITITEAAPSATPAKQSIKNATTGAKPVPSKPAATTAAPATTTTPATVTAEPQKPVVPQNQASALAMFLESGMFLNILWGLAAALSLFLAWHRYQRGVPPFYFTFEGKPPMTPPTPEVLLKQFEELKEVIKQEAINLQSAKAGQSLSESEQRFITLFEKLITEIEKQY